jgi:hypothetical protein
MNIVLWGYPGETLGVREFHASAAPAMKAAARSSKKV